MPALQIPEGSRSDFLNHVARHLTTIISHTTSGPEAESWTDASHYARAESVSMRKSASNTGLWSSSSVDAAGILAAQQRRQIQILCSAMASVSIFAAMCAIYWFVMMRRNYRRDLVLMLILGDFYKSLWYLIHGSVNFARSQVTSQEAFCQVSGFMLQVGLQACGKSSYSWPRRSVADEPTRCGHPVYKHAHGTANLPSSELFPRPRRTVQSTPLGLRRLDPASVFHSRISLCKPQWRLSGPRRVLLVANPALLVSSGTLMGSTLSHLALHHVRRHPHLQPRRLRVPSLWPGERSFVKRRPLSSKLCRAWRDREGCQRAPFANRFQE